MQSARAGLEPHERVLVPPAGSRGHPRPGAGVRAGRRRRRAGCRPGLGTGSRRPLCPCGRLHVVLRQCRHPLRGGDLQAAGPGRAVGPDHRGALRRTGPEAASPPLRSAGELARADRGPTREQRPADRAGDAGRHLVQAGPRPERAVTGVERGARTADAVGSAVVVADATGAGLRDRPARVRGHSRREPRRRGADSRAAAMRPRPSWRTSWLSGARSRPSRS